MAQQITSPGLYNIGVIDSDADSVEVIDASNVTLVIAGARNVETVVRLSGVCNDVRINCGAEWVDVGRGIVTDAFGSYQRLSISNLDLFKWKDVALQLQGDITDGELVNSRINRFGYQGISSQQPRAILFSRLASSLMEFTLSNVIIGGVLATPLQSFINGHAIEVDGSLPGEIDGEGDYIPGSEHTLGLLNFVNGCILVGCDGAIVKADCDTMTDGISATGGGTYVVDLAGGNHLWADLALNSSADYPISVALDADFTAVRLSQAKDPIEYIGLTRTLDTATVELINPVNPDGTAIGVGDPQIDEGIPVGPSLTTTRSTDTYSDNRGTQDPGLYVPTRGALDPDPFRDLGLGYGINTEGLTRTDVPSSIYVDRDLTIADFNPITYDFTEQPSEESERVLWITGSVYRQIEAANATRVAELFVNETLAPLDARVLIAGDHAYDSGTAQEFAAFDQIFASVFGKSRVIPARGNNDQDPSGSGRYDDYYDIANEYGNRYFSMKYGPAQIIVLDSNEVVSLQDGGAQFMFVQNVLDTPHRGPTIVAMHHHRWSSWTKDGYGDLPEYSDLYALLAEKDVDVVLSGHTHFYERTRRVNHLRNPDASGFIQIHAGTGGNGMGGGQHISSQNGVDQSQMNAPDGSGSMSAAVVHGGQPPIYGAVRLTLRPRDFDIAYVDVEGTIRDSVTKVAVGF